MAELRRVGHKGADLLAPGNTRESFDAALEHGVDMIEFDVLPEPDTGRLILAHDYREATRVRPLTLEEGLSHLASEPFKEIDLDVDLKLPGYEQRVIDALAEHGLIERSIISSQYRSSLARIRVASPSVRLGWSVPRARRDYTDSPLLAIPSLALLAVIRQVLPWRASAAIHSRRCDAIMAHWRLVSARLVEAVNAAGGELYVWTVDERPRIQALEALGVTGVITNDPRLFDARASLDR